MIRLAGCIMLLASSTALGFGAANSMKERIKELDSMILSIRAMELELAARRTPLPELLKRAGHCASGRINLFYNLCESRLGKSEGVIFSEIWKAAAETVELHIKEQETMLFLEVGNILGRYDAGSQCAALQTAREQFAGFAENAKEQYSRMGRVYSTLGIAAGALLMIVLI